MALSLHPAEERGLIKSCLRLPVLTLSQETADAIEAQARDTDSDLNRMSVDGLIDHIFEMDLEYRRTYAPLLGHEIAVALANFRMRLNGEIGLKGEIA